MYCLNADFVYIKYVRYDLKVSWCSQLCDYLLPNVISCRIYANVVISTALPNFTCLPLAVAFFLSIAKQPPPSGLGPLHCRGCMITFRHRHTHTHTHTHTLGRTPLDKWSARRIDVYLTTHNTHNRQTSMSRRDSNPQLQQASGCRPTP
jgi:hypothetical protein